MSVAYESMGICCPIDLLDMGILAAYEADPGRRRPTDLASPATIGRRARALAALGFLRRPHASQRGWVSNVGGLQVAHTWELIQRERPDLPDILDGRLDLAILTTIVEGWHPFEPWDVACTSRSAWYQRIDAMADQALVLHAPNAPRPNPDLPSLHRLVALYKTLAGLMRAPGANGRHAAVTTVHQRGGEIAWRTPPDVSLDAAPVPSQAGRQASPLAPTHLFWYRGQRRLDELDELLIPLCDGENVGQGAPFEHTERYWQDSGVRQTAAVVARLGDDSLTNHVVHDRLGFYGLSHLANVLRGVANGRYAHILQQAHEMTERFDVRAIDGL